MKKNKKGFTLVELLAAVSILGIITIIALPQISKLMQENNEAKYKKYGEAIVTASKLYTDSYTKDMFGNNEVGCYYVDLSEMINKGLINDIKIDDITCNVTDETYVKVSKNKDNYKYGLSIKCKDSKGNDKYPHSIAKGTCKGGDDKEPPVIKIEPSEQIKTAIDSEAWIGTFSGKMKVIIQDDSGLLENAEVQYTWTNFEIVPTSYDKSFYFENKRNEDGSNPIEGLIDLPENANGIYYLHVMPSNVYDSLGNKAETTDICSAPIKIDTTPPTVPTIDMYRIVEEENCTKKVLGVCWSKETIEKRITINENTQITIDELPVYTEAKNSVEVGAGSGFDKYQYKLQEDVEPTDGSTYKHGQNQYLIYYRACDKAGNCSNYASTTIKVQGDTVAPECETSGGSSSWTNQNVTITGTCSDPTCAEYGLEWQTWRFVKVCKVSTEASGCVNNKVTKVITENTNSSISPGVVEDNVGNKTTCGKETVKIDKDAPNPPTYSVSTDSSTGEKTIYISATDNGPSGIDYYQCSLSGAQSRSGFKKYTGLLKPSVSIDKNGTTTLSCYSVDNAGNSSSDSSTTVSVTLVEEDTSSSSGSSSSGSSSSGSSSTPTSSVPSAPTISIYQWKNDSTKPTSSSGLTKISSGSTSSVSVYTEAYSSGASYYEYTTTGTTTNETNTKRSHRNIQAEGNSTIKYRACNSNGQCSSYTTASITIVRCSSTTTTWGKWSTCNCKTGKKTRTGTKYSTINNKNCGTTTEKKDCTSECKSLCDESSSTIFGGTYKGATAGNYGAWVNANNSWGNDWCHADDTKCYAVGGYERICVIEKCKGMTAKEIENKYGCDFASYWCSCKQKNKKEW